MSMPEKKIYELKIDLEFKKLIPPLTTEEFKLLKENIIRDGCREPLCVWNDVIIDGHNRYDICTTNNIPFYIQPLKFINREDAQNWICANQLGRRNISEETRKYLIGKRYQMEKLLQKNPNGANQYSYMIEIPEETIKQKNKKTHKPRTAVKLGVEYQIAGRTVIEYGNYAHSIDILEKDEPELVARVLKGEIKIGQQKLINLSQQSSKIKNKIKKYLNEQEKIHKKPPVECTERRVTVKDMPKYDPDAEIVSLSFTIPSWIGSVDRVLDKVNFENTSIQARQKLKSELNNLKFTVDTILLAMEGE